MQALLAAIANAAPGTDARRVFHGRGGCAPGEEAWALDLYPPVAVLTSFRQATEEELATVGRALAARWPGLSPDQPLCWVHQCRHEGRSETRTMAGAVPEGHLALEDGLRYELNLLNRGQGRHHGLFLDMAEGRRWLRSHLADCAGARVLNLFAYTCAFSVVALAAGAGTVVNLDMSAGALATGRRNHRHNGLETGALFLAHDLFKSWGKLRRSGPYDVIIVDPPSYQKGSFVATKDYARVLRRLPELLAPGGHALLCLNAPELPEAFLRDALLEAAPALQMLQRLPNPASFADVSPDRALKVMVAKAPD